MAEYKLLLPKMGESVAEATIIKWTKAIGDTVQVEDVVVEIATDKVDSDVPSPVEGKIVKFLFNENEVANVGDVIAILEIEGANEQVIDQPSPQIVENSAPITKSESIEQPAAAIVASENSNPNSDRFFSPLVKNMVQQEGISDTELALIKGTGTDGRLTKNDISAFLKSKNEGLATSKSEVTCPANSPNSSPIKVVQVSQASNHVKTAAGDEIIEMDRMRKLIADHMVMSKQVSPHVTSFVEADVTNIVRWREKVKTSFEQREQEKITFTPIFIEAVIKALKDFPLVNVSVNGTQIIKKKNINIGMAAALPTGNLIVPVIKNADQLNLVGLCKAVNDLANRARNQKLLPEDTQGGTFTITNIGSFGNIMGTPIINQPQAAILAIGAIQKKPAVLETEYGDTIAIRHKMYLSLSYDHRVVDGALGGTFLKRIADYMEDWDLNREF